MVYVLLSMFLIVDISVCAMNHQDDLIEKVCVSIQNHNSLETIEGFIKQGVNLNKEYKGKLPLKWALNYWNPIDCIHLLCKYGADLNQESEDRWAFELIINHYYASKKQMPSLVGLLLKYGANGGMQNKDGDTCLHKSLFSTIKLFSRGIVTFDWFVYFVNRYCKNRYEYEKSIISTVVRCNYVQKKNKKFFFCKPILAHILNYIYPDSFTLSGEYSANQYNHYRKILDKKNNNGVTVYDIICNTLNTQGLFKDRYFLALKENYPNFKQKKL